ncbi:hypothetical protein L9F63_016813, partial [Diploptera punctata]
KFGVDTRRFALNCGGHLQWRWWEQVYASRYNLGKYFFCVLINGWLYFFSWSLCMVYHTNKEVDIRRKWREVWCIIHSDVLSSW